MNPEPYRGGLVEKDDGVRAQQSNGGAEAPLVASTVSASCLAGQKEHRLNGEEQVLCYELDR